MMKIKGIEEFEVPFHVNFSKGILYQIFTKVLKNEWN